MEAYRRTSVHFGSSRIGKACKPLHWSKAVLNVAPNWTAAAAIEALRANSDPISEF
jgi:hypothetical protein